MSRVALLALPFAAAALLVSGCDEYECPGLPDETIPVDWGAYPDGFDTAAFDAEVREQMRAGCVPALTMAVVDVDGVILSAAYGWTSLESLEPVTVETPFQVASTSKAVDAIAVLHAEADGLLRRDDAVSDLVGFRVRNERLGDGRTIRLSHLATHTSGIRDNWNILDPTYVDGDPTESLESFLRGYLRPGGEHFSRRNNFHAWPAGREWLYSNVGAALAALAVQEQAGQPFDDYCEEHIFGPLGMRNTGWFLSDFEDPDLVARPHSVEDGDWVVEEHYGFSTWPDGQLRSTATDLGQILRVRLGDGVVDGVRVLPAGSTDVLEERQFAEADEWYIRGFVRQQNFFWFEQRLRGRTIVGHDGDDTGTTAELFYEPATGVGVALVGNIVDGYPGLDTRDATATIESRLFAIGEAHR